MRVLNRPGGLSTGRRKLGALIVAAALVVGSAAVVRGIAGLSCLSVPEGAITESTVFTPYEDRLTRTPESPILKGQEAPSTASEETFDGLPLRLERGGSKFFLDGEIGPNMTPSEFAAAGGVRFYRVTLDPAGESYVVAMLRDFPGRAVAVDVGGHKGVLTWADPDANGTRPHHLYWADGAFGYVIIAVRSPAVMLNLARGVVCGPG